MSPCQARALCITLLLVGAACKKARNPLYVEIGGLPGPPANSAVLPATCSARGFELDGTVWQVTGSAESTASACDWPIGEVRSLCDMRWTFVADPISEGLYRVHYNETGSYFIGLLCGDELYLDGVIATSMESTGCAPGAASTFGTIVGDGAPALARLTFADTPPASGTADVGSGDLNVHVGFGNCEWSLLLSLTRDDALPLVHGGAGTGRLVLHGDPELAAELARDDLGVLLCGADQQRTWLSMELLSAGRELEVELAPGTWSLSIATRSGSHEHAELATGAVEVRAGERAALAWDRR